MSHNGCEVLMAIKEARCKAGLTQVEFAHRMGVSQGEISRIENGARNVTVERLHALARAINVASDGPARQAVQVAYRQLKRTSQGQQGTML